MNSQLSNQVYVRHHVTPAEYWITSVKVLKVFFLSMKVEHQAVMQTHHAPADGRRD